MRGYARRVAAQPPRGRLLPDAVWSRRHRSITVLLWLHVPALLAFAIVRGYGVVHSTSEILLVISLAVVATLPRLGRAGAIGRLIVSPPRSAEDLGERHEIGTTAARQEAVWAGS